VRPPRDGDRDRLRAALAPFFDRCDVLVMPSLAWPCPPARRWGERSWTRSVVAALRFAPMTGVWNMAGYPAASVPAPPVPAPHSASVLSSPSASLPGSVQLVAAPGGESLLLALAAQLERARPWPRHAPAYS
jgi:amidase